jgi:hypothetical protein
MLAFRTDSLDAVLSTLEIEKIRPILHAMRSSVKSGVLNGKN